MNVFQYIDKVINTKDDIYVDIEFEGIIEERTYIEKLINANLPLERKQEAWEMIIGDVCNHIDRRIQYSFLGERILEYLINKKICLIELGHLDLPDIWLLKIYKADDRAVEALLTYLKRHINKNTTIEKEEKHEEFNSTQN